MNKQIILITIIILFSLQISYSQEKKFYNANECIELVEAKKNNHMADGNHIYNVYINNLCDKTLKYRIITTKKDGPYVKNYCTIRPRNEGDKYKHIAREAVSSSTGEFKFEVYEISMDK